MRKSYLEELERIQGRVNALFEETLLGSGYGGDEEREPGTWAPVVDVMETDGAYVLFAELPGVRRGDIDLQATERRLELSGRRRPLGEGRNFLRLERSYGPFRRAFDLAQPIDPEGISATFERGILRIEVRKRPPRTIEVKDNR